MCDLCAKHGDGGKWYLNAAHYADEIVRKYNLRDYLLEQYRNFEQVPLRKVNGFNPVGFDYKLKIPLIGRLLRRMAEHMLHSTKPPRNPFRAEGHIGQVVPLEDATAILECCAAEPIIEKNCMCRYMSRGIQEACCINFGVMSDIISKLPRFIPVKDKFFLSRKEAVEKFTAFNNKGFIGTIWFGPFPYINNLCSCATPECAGIRPRLDFGIKSIYKAEYVADVRADACTGCGACEAKCQFGALHKVGAKKTVDVNLDKCYGCGVCRHACATGALYLRSRDEVPEIAEKY
ncbi:MAG TPA: 4Fe-4S dicluster domain-containing protein [Chitinivibrionales bacterium]|jgi:ferredoxin|nr:4Fe-4S dicluster domain-containing protein [Chitinivibrionales bacterium]